MYKVIVAFLLVSSASFFALPVHAQMMGGANIVDDGHTAREEAEGKEIVQKLNAGTLTCAKVTEDQFERIGEYYMGLMLGDSHVAMNAMMIRQLGEAGEEQMHVIMGERFSGCNPTAGQGSSVIASSWFPMMGMMGGVSGPAWSTGMMGGGWNIFSLITMLLFWTVAIIALIALVRVITQPKNDSRK
jgi:hypothetical protein